MMAHKQRQAITFPFLQRQGLPQRRGDGTSSEFSAAECWLVPCGNERRRDKYHNVLSRVSPSFSISVQCRAVQFSVPIKCGMQSHSSVRGHEECYDAGSLITSSVHKNAFSMQQTVI